MGRVLKISCVIVALLFAFVLLPSGKSEAIVKYSVLSEGKQIFASRYKLYLPTEEEFKQLLESI